MNLRLPKFAHLYGCPERQERNTDGREKKSLTWSALSLNTGINERIWAGPNAGFYRRDQCKQGTGHSCHPLNRLTMIRRWAVGRETSKAKLRVRYILRGELHRSPTNLFLVRLAFGKNETCRSGRRDFSASARRKSRNVSRSDRSYLLPRVSTLS